MKKLICKIFGHKFRYNFSWMPTKCICSRCHKKWVAKELVPYQWVIVDRFEKETRDDKTLSEKWIK